MFKVRFHLGRGPNFEKFQVKQDDGKVSYFDPKLYQLKMIGCKLHNKPKIAEKIFRGESNKTVCSWIECRDVEVYPTRGIRGKSLVSYNPRIAPYWREGGENVDFHEYEVLITHDRKVYRANTPTL
tara:strand:+ start:95 stop:472 length:378 start_codon:yes stop_codon:yes gene_type:complete